MTEFFTHKVGTNNYSAIFGGWTADPSPINRGVWYNYIHQGKVDYISDNFDGGSEANAYAYALPGYRLKLYKSDLTTVVADSNADTTKIRKKFTAGYCDAGQLFTS